MSGEDTKRDGRWWWISWLVITGSLALILLAKRPTAPTQSIGLQYDTAAAASEMSKDEALSKKKLSAEAKRVLELRNNRNLSQLGRMPPEWDRAAESTELGELGAKLRTSAADQLETLRARVADEAIAALTGKLKPEEAERVLGGSIAMLRRYKLAIGPHLRAPRFVLRTFYKARLNQLLGLSAIDGFSEAERLAHFGWPAFHATNTPAAQRIQMLDLYQQEKGERAQELRPELLLRAGAPGKAITVYEGLAEQTGNLRYRNHALFIREQVRQNATNE